MAKLTLRMRLFCALIGSGALAGCPADAPNTGTDSGDQDSNGEIDPPGDDSGESSDNRGTEDGETADADTAGLDRPIGGETSSGSTGGSTGDRDPSSDSDGTTGGGGEPPEETGIPPGEGEAPGEAGVPPEEGGDNDADPPTSSG